MNPFDNQEHQQKNKVEKTKPYSLTSHCVQTREPTLTFDLLSKMVKYGYIYTSLCLSSSDFCQYDLDGADLWCHCFIHQPSWISATFPHVAIATSCLWTEMFAICPAAASPLDCEGTTQQIFFHSSWLLENEIHFGSSHPQSERLYLFAVNGNLKPRCSMSSVPFSLKTGDGQHFTKLSLRSWQYLLAMNSL